MQSRLLPLFVSICVCASALGQPYVPQGRWMRFATPEAGGFDSKKLERARRAWEELPSSSFMVVHEGAVVAAWGDVTRRFMCHSVRKSLLSGLIGACVDEGTIDEYATLAELGIDDEEPSLTDVEKQACILDLLMARSGVYHSAAYETPTMKSRRPARGSHQPGSFWYYNNWDFNTLLTIYEQQAGKKIFRDFQDRFARPLGMQDYRPRDGYYHLEKDESRHPAYPLRMSARDMARFGLLYLNDGVWGDRRILSRRWVRRSAETYSSSGPFDPQAPKQTGYGLLWWTYNDTPLARYGMYSALGVGNQMIAVLPKVKMVLVNRANTYEGKKTPTGPLLELVQQVVEARRGSPLASASQLLPLGASPGAVDIELVDSPAPENIAGEYRHPAVSLGVEQETTISIRVRQGKAFMHNPSAGTFQLFPQGDGKYIVEDALAPVRLERDADGAVVGVVSPSDFVRVAVDAIQEGDPQRGLALLTRGCESFPDSLSAQTFLAVMQLANGLHSDATSQLRRVTTKWPQETGQVESLLRSSARRLFSDNRDVLGQIYEANAELFPTSSQARTDLEEHCNKETIAWLEEQIPLYMEDSRTPGFSIAMVRNGETIYAEGFGLRDTQQKLPTTPDTLFGIGSITKSFVALGILQLAEQGKLRLHDPVGDHIPFRLGLPGKPITLHHFLTHSSGIPSLATSTVALSRGLGRDTGIPFGSADDFYRFVNGAQNEIVATPGQRYFYHNGAWRMLGHVIQVKSGMPFHAYIKQHVIDPLGMERTTLDISAFEADSNHITPHLKIREKNEPTSFPYPNPGDNPDFSFISAAGGIVSSVNEMTRYLNAHIHLGEYGDARLASKASFRKMQTKHIDTPGGDYGKAGYGYGLSIAPDFLGEKMISHGGSILVSTAHMACVPQRKLGVVMMSNNAGMPHSTIARSVLAKLQGREPSEVIRSIQIKERMKRLAGGYQVYRGLESVQVTVRRGMLYLDSQSRWSGSTVSNPLIPQDPSLKTTSFYLLSNGSKTPVEFKLRDDGGVDLYWGRYCYHKRD